MGMAIEEKQNLINMFREQIFPSQARTLLKQNFENKGELDKQEYLRDTNIILDLAEKGLQVEFIQADYEARLKADKVAMLTEIQLEIEECVDGGEGSPQFELGVATAQNQVLEMIQEHIDALRGGENEAN